MPQSLPRRLRNYFTIGVLLVTPLVATALVVEWMLNVIERNALLRFLASQIGRLLPFLPERRSTELMLVGLALLIVILALVLLGMFVRNIVGRRLVRWAERVFGRIPFINRIYLFIRQVSEALFAQGQRVFKEVVLIPYPRAGLYTIAFVTGRPADEIRNPLAASGIPDEFVCLFIPTTPNPTSGFMIVAPRKDLLPLRLTVTEAMRLVVSGGAAPTDGPPGTNLIFLDRLDAWFQDLPPAESAKPTEPTPPP